MNPASSSMGAFCTASLFFLAMSSAAAASLRPHDLGSAQIEDARKPERGTALAASAATAQEVLELSGFREQVEQIPALIQVQLQQRQNSLDPDVYAVVSRVLLESFRADSLYTTVVQRFAADADPERLNAVLEWLRSPLAQKMIRLEVEAGTPEGQQKLKDYAAALQGNPPAQIRLALVKRLDEATRTTELAIATSASMVGAMMGTLQAQLPPEKRMDEAQVGKELSRMKAQLQAPMKNNTLVNFLFTYRSVSDEELTQYLSFWESETGRWFGRASSQAFLGAMAAASADAGKRIQETASPPQRVE